MRNLNLKDWHMLFRTEHALITFFGVLVGELLVTRSFSFSLLFPTIGPVLITLAAFVINDYFGLKTDKANGRRDRPLVSGKIKPETALYATIILFALGLAFAWFVNSLVFMLAAVYVYLTLLYDNVFKKLPLIGNLFIALTMTAPFVYGNFAVANSLVPSVILIAIIAFLTGTGRELIITLRDVAGDKRAGGTTLPMLIGPKNTVILSAIFISIAVLLSFAPLLSFLNILPFLEKTTSDAQVLYVALVSICDYLLLTAVFKTLKSQDLVTLKECRNKTLLALAIGVLAFLGFALL